MILEVPELVLPNFSPSPVKTTYILCKYLLTRTWDRCYNQIPPSERAGMRSSVTERKFSWEGKTKIKKSQKSVDTDRNTWYYIRVASERYNNECKASSQRCCRTTEFCMKAISWKQAFRNHFHTKTALLVPWQINSNATLKILNEKVRKDKALKKIQRTRNSRKQAKANLTVSHLIFGSDGRIGSTRCWSGLRTKTFNWEFDPGSGWTLAACLTHASRTEMRCEREVLAQNNLFVS